jgi:hypothetical protein
MAIPFISFDNCDALAKNSQLKMELSAERGMDWDAGYSIPASKKTVRKNKLSPDREW